MHDNSDNLWMGNLGMEKEYGGKKTYLTRAFTLKLWTMFKNKQIEFSKSKIKFILPIT